SKPAAILTPPRPPALSSRWPLRRFRLRMNALARCAAGLLLSTICLPLSALAADPQPTHEFTLDNGVKVVVREDHRAPVVVSQVWYKVGSSYETPGQTGLSHALEHMMFKGSSKA